MSEHLEVTRTVEDKIKKFMCKLRFHRWIITSNLPKYLILTRRCSHCNKTQYFNFHPAINAWRDRG
jgi:hypothetical protein